MKESEENIQKLVETNQHVEGADVESYKIVFNALKKRPDFKLPSNFAHRVSAMAPSQAKAFDWDKLFLISGCISFLIALIYSILTLHAKFSVGIFSFVSGYPGLIVFAIAFVIFLNWIDKKWISKSTHV